jgi:hypothetical protein
VGPSFSFVSVPRPRRADRRGARWSTLLAIGGLLAGVIGCATNQEQNPPATSVQSVQYYPFLVKGYENMYPKRRAVVLPATDQRDFADTGGADHSPNGGRPAIGAVVDQQGKVIERLFGPPLETLVQDAVVHAANEAGMAASPTAVPLHQELTGRAADYVITESIQRFWVTKGRGPDEPDGPSWHAVAEVILNAVVYKPPFAVASAVYTDPPAPANGMNLGDEAEIYDQPGEVLSVALTRAVAQIFKRDDLHTLVEQDTMRTH